MSKNSFPKKFEQDVKAPPGRQQSNLSLSQNKDRIATNKERMRKGWLPLNNGAQAGP